MRRSYRRRKLTLGIVLALTAAALLVAGLAGTPAASGSRPAALWTSELAGLHISSRPAAAVPDARVAFDEPTYAQPETVRSEKNPTAVEYDNGPFKQIYTSFPLSRPAPRNEGGVAPHIHQLTKA